MNRSGNQADAKGGAHTIYSVKSWLRVGLSAMGLEGKDIEYIEWAGEANLL